jgi:hypothetical protein
VERIQVELRSYLEPGYDGGIGISLYSVLLETEMKPVSKALWVYLFKN